MSPQPSETSVVQPAETSRAAQHRPRDTSLGVYIHFPWCLKKCPYCDFLSVAADPAAIPHEAYADAVLAELSGHIQTLERRPVRSLFFGGGTPSLWRPRELGRVLSGVVRELSRGKPPMEVTVECNPTSFDATRAHALRDVGVTRVSIGVQGLSSRRLAFLGRLHDPDGGLRAVRAALAAGIPRVSADLIFGVAGQSAAEAAEEALRLAELGLTHLSLYALTIEPGTQFGARARRGRLPLLDENAVADSFLAVSEALQSQGFEHYEISNFAREGHRAEHNLGYWRGADYLGLGCGAWGTVTVGGIRTRYRNTPAPERYLRWGSPGSRDASRDPQSSEPDRLRQGPDPGPLLAHREDLSPATSLSERLMLGLRLAEGVDVEAAAAELDADPWPPERLGAVRRLVDRGRLRQDGPRLWIPRSAWLLADGTIAELL